MDSRLVEILVPSSRAARVKEIIDQGDLDWSWNQSADGTTVFKLLVQAQDVEDVLDPLQSLVDTTEGARVVILPVEAASPRAEDLRLPVDKQALSTPRKRKAWHRISREELYEDLDDFAAITPPFLVMTVLSTVVAAIGVARNSAAVLIGAMVIAPLLGPNMALALGTTLGDLRLAGRALLANVAGVVLAFGVALLAGLVWTIDTSGSEVAARTVVSFEEILLALATGTAGAMAVTTGVASSLIGVMVAAALLPPLVITAMLLTSGHPQEAGGAFLLLVTNVVCVNLSGVATFYLQGIKPKTWWKKEQSRRATRIALAIWITLLAVVTVVIVLLRTGEI